MILKKKKIYHRLTFMKFGTQRVYKSVISFERVYVLAPSACYVCHKIYECKTLGIYDRTDTTVWSDSRKFCERIVNKYRGGVRGSRIFKYSYILCCIRNA